MPYYDAYDTDIILGYLSGHATNDLTEVRNDANSYELSFIANYDKSFADSHNFNAMLGYEEYYYYHEAWRRQAPVWLSETSLTLTLPTRITLE